MRNNELHIQNQEDFQMQIQVYYLPVPLETKRATAILQKKVFFHLNDIWYLVFHLKFWKWILWLFNHSCTLESKYRNQWKRN